MIKLIIIKWIISIKNDEININNINNSNYYYNNFTKNNDNNDKLFSFNKSSDYYSNHTSKESTPFSTAPCSVVLSPEQLFEDQSELSTSHSNHSFTEKDQKNSNNKYKTNYNNQNKDFWHFLKTFSKEIIKYILKDKKRN